MGSSAVAWFCVFSLSHEGNLVGIYRKGGCTDMARTMTTTSTASASVTQADREAAAKWVKSNSRHMQAANILRGSCDTAPLVKAFAAHRSASIAAMDEVVRALEPFAEAFKQIDDGRAVWLPREVEQGYLHKEHLAAAAQALANARAAMGEVPAPPKPA